MTWAATKWGAVCQAVANFVLEVYPQFSVGIGPDPEELIDAGYRITFIAEDDGSFDEPSRAGDLETHPTFDEDVPVTVTIACKLDLDTATNYDRSPALLEQVVARFLEGCDAEAHTPYLVPLRHRRRGGRIGEYGAKAIIRCAVRIRYERTYATLATATAVTTSFGVEGPDGDGGTVVDDFEVIGDAP